MIPMTAFTTAVELTTTPTTCTRVKLLSSPARRPCPELATALRAPNLSIPKLRATNEHLLLAQRGDAVIRTVLLGVGAKLGLTFSGRDVSFTK